MSAPSEVVHYVYCILAEAEEGSLPLPPLCGVGGAPLEMVDGDGLAALTSRLPAGEWTEAAVEERLADGAWVEREVRRHEEVVEAMLALADLLPCRFLTLFSSPEAIRRTLRDDGDRIRRSLLRVAGRREWSVKLIAALEPLQAHCREDPELSALAGRLAEAEGGRSFFLRKKYQRDLADLTARVMEETAARIETALSSLAPDGYLRADTYELDSGKRMLLNAALLLTEAGAEELKKTLAHLEGGIARGLYLSSSGPWPPYHFAGEAPRGGE